MQNKTSLFALAMIEPNMHNTNYRNHYDSAYVNISSRPLDYEIALLYRFFPDTTEGSNEIISLDDGKYLVIYPILEKYKVDFDYFLKGAYSKFKPEIKQRIASYYGWRSQSYFVVIKDPSLKRKLEQSIGQKLDEDAEYFSTIDTLDETFKLDKNAV